MLNLNGQDLPSFVKVNQVGFSILPTIKNNTLSVRGRKGVYLYGQEMTDRTITADITILAEEVNGVMAATRELAAWLYQPEETKLIISDEPDKYYLVVPDGSTDIDELMKTGTGSITFLCTETLAYGEEKEHTFTNGADEVETIIVEGTAETYPEIELQVNKNLSSIAVVADNGAVIIGEPTEATKTVTNPKPRRMHDPMENINNWTQAVSVDDGYIMGEFTSTNGYGVSQTEKNYGTVTDNSWHGASKLRYLSTPLQDFEAQALVAIEADSIKELGRIEMYLLNQNGRHIGKIGIMDAITITNQPIFYAQAGDAAGDGTTIIRSGTNKNFKNFYGRLIISRKGNKWTASAYVKSGDKYTYKIEKTFTDKANAYMDKVAGIQIHIAAIGTATPVKNMQVTGIDVYEYVELTSVQAPIIAEDGDILLIDCKNSLVYKNGEVFYEGINPASTFFNLQAGGNMLAVTEDLVPVTVRYTERWL